MESVRTCLVCRTRGEKSDFLRFVRSLDGEICFDEKGELEHRGAWVCAKKICLEKAFKKRLMFRNERVLPVDAEAMKSLIKMRLRKSTLSRLGLIRRLGQIEMGKEAALHMVSLNQAHAVIVAKDFSARSIKDVIIGASKVNARVINTDFSMDELGQSLGRKKTGVVALLKSRITDEILLQLNKLKEIE
jgi:uncharacterized protein